MLPSINVDETACSINKPSLKNCSCKTGSNTPKLFTIPVSKNVEKTTPTNTSQDRI